MKLKQIVSAILAVGAMGAATLAHADIYPDFTVNPTVFGGASTTASSFVADKITGNYVEVITFGAGTFNISLYWQAGQFVANDGTSTLPGSGTFGTGLGSNYGLYALFTGSGTFTSGATTTFSLSPGGTLGVFIDKGLDNNPAVGVPATGSGSYVIAGSGNDTKIADGAGISGTGNVSCIGGNNCGSFGQTTSFNLLNPAGTNYFIQPSPFYDISLQSGQFNGFPVVPGNTVTLNGSMDVIFTKVPEPTTLALVGLALVGLGVATRRRQA